MYRLVVRWLYCRLMDSIGLMLVLSTKQDQKSRHNCCCTNKIHDMYDGSYPYSRRSSSIIEACECVICMYIKYLFIMSSSFYGLSCACMFQHHAVHPRFQGVKIQLRELNSLRGFSDERTQQTKKPLFLVSNANLDLRFFF